MTREFHKRVGRERYAELLRDIVDRPGTIAEFVERWGHAKTLVYRLVHTFRHMGLLYVSGWRERKHKPLQPVFAFGDQPDATPPSVRRNGRPVNGTPRATCAQPLLTEAIALGTLLEALHEPLSPIAAATATGIDPQRIRRLLEHLRALRLVYVHAWERRPKGGLHVPHFAFGIDKRDAPRLPRDRAAANARYRAKQRVRQGRVAPLIQTLAANGYQFQQQA